MALTFDANYYLSARPDVFNAFVKANGSTGLTWAQFAENHYNTFGRFEGSNPNSVFNTTEYLTANPDVAAAGVNPFQHFLTFGVNEGRSPNASFPTFASFDSATYLSSNPDLAAAGITTKAQAWAHFVVYGEFEGRPGAPVVDNGIAGSTFTLTNAVGEGVVGSNGNDTFKAVFDDGTVTTSTLNIGDQIDGKGGVDKLELISAAGGSASLAAGFSTTSVEQVFITNGALTAVDANTFSGVQQLWMVNNAAIATVSNLTDKTTLGVKGDATAKVSGDFGSATAINVALDGAKGAVDVISTGTNETVSVSGSSLVSAGVAQTVTLAGSGFTTAGALNVAAANTLKLDVTAGGDVVTTKVTGAGAADLGTLGAKTKTLDASANTGGVTAVGVAATQEVTGGAGKDSFNLGGALNDKGFINTGAGDDSVNIVANAINSGATISLGDGNDSIIGTGIVNKAAVIDGGAGSDTLALTLVGAANVGAFSNFEVFDVNALNGNLDLDILASKNTVTEIVGSGPLGGNSTLTNLGAGVNFRATANMNTAAALTLDQKTAGAITVTLDVDTTKTGAPLGNDASTKVILEDATSATVKFDSSSFDAQVSGGLRNTQTIDLQTKAATTITVQSGGANADNVLVLNDTSVKAGDSLLTKIVVTGDQALDATALTIGGGANKLAEVDASAHTGGLTIDLADIADGGLVKIGSGTDIKN